MILLHDIENTSGDVAPSITVVGRQNHFASAKGDDNEAPGAPRSPQLCASILRDPNQVGWKRIECGTYHQKQLFGFFGSESRSGAIWSRLAASNGHDFSTPTAASQLQIAPDRDSEPKNPKSCFW